MDNGRRAVVYAHCCSTDENRQNVEVQPAELRRYAQAFGGNVDEAWEYDSGFKGKRPTLQAVLKRIRRKEYDTLLVFQALGEALQAVLAAGRDDESVSQQQASGAVV